MGSRSHHYAYIAGFLDGDGSLMLQLKKRKDSQRGIRFMATICFYQDTRHEKPLYWIRDILGIGYVSKRNDHMTELRINGYSQIRNILKQLLPYFQFKKRQAMALYQACEILSRTSIKNLNRLQRHKLVKHILDIQNENYVTKKKKTQEELYMMLDLTP